MLDTNVLARLCHPSAHRDVQTWFRDVLRRGDDAPEILVSVLADYEMRRSLLGRQATVSLELLDRISEAVRYVAVTREATRRAAEMCAALAPQARTGISDADLIMVAQANIEGAVLVTSDLALRSLPGVRANDWAAIELEK